MDAGFIEPVEEGEMSNLAVGFASWMRKQATSAQGEANPSFEIPGGKHHKQSGSSREVQEIQAVVTLDSLERALEAIPALEGTAREVPRNPVRHWKMVS